MPQTFLMYPENQADVALIWQYMALNFDEGTHGWVWDTLCFESDPLNGFRDQSRHKPDQNHASGFP